MKNANTFNKNVFSFFLFFLFLVFAGCSSSEKRQEEQRVVAQAPDCIGVPAKNQEILVAQVEQPKQKNVVAAESKTTTRAEEPAKKQEVKTVPPQNQKKTEVVQVPVPVERKVPTTIQKPQELPQQQLSQAKNLLAQIQSKLDEAKKVGPGEKRQELLVEAQKLGNQIKSLAKNGDAEAVELKKGSAYKDAARLCKQLCDEKVAGQLVQKTPEPDLQAKVEVGKKEEAGDLVVRPEEKITQTPTPQQSEKVVPPNSGTPTADPETSLWSSYWLWVVVGVVVVLGVLWLRRTRRIAQHLALLEEECFAELHKVNHPFADLISDHEKAKYTRFFKKLPDENQSATEETKKEPVEPAAVVANTEPAPAGANQEIAPELAKTLTEAETAEEQVTASEETQLRGGAPAEVVKENPTATPQQEAGALKETSAVEKKEAAAPMSEAEWQKLLARVCPKDAEGCRMELYPTGSVSSEQTLNGAQAAERKFREICRKKVAASVKKAERWHHYWQEASKGAVESDLKIYCLTNLEKARRDLVKAQGEQQQFEAKLKLLQKRGKKGDKKCRGKKK